MEYYHNVGDLRIPPDINPEEIEHGINQYLNTVDMIIKQLNTNFKKGNPGLLNRNMMLTLKLLRNIHAEKLETAGHLIVKALKNGQTDICQKAFPIFTANLQALSNEINNAKERFLI